LASPILFLSVGLHKVVSESSSGKRSSSTPFLTSTLSLDLLLKLSVFLEKGLFPLLEHFVLFHKFLLLALKHISLHVELSSLVLNREDLLVALVFKFLVLLFQQLDFRLKAFFVFVSMLLCVCQSLLSLCLKALNFSDMLFFLLGEVVEFLFKGFLKLLFLTLNNLKTLIQFSLLLL
jgi:hypothetical protein